jgi:hypothetical protein
MAVAGRINVGRLLLMGLVTGIVVDVIEDVVTGWALGAQFTQALVALGRGPFTLAEIALFNLWGLIVGQAAAFVYVGLRARFGAGPVTAFYAALVIWVTAYFLHYWALAIIGMPAVLMVTVGVVGLVEIVVATIVGMHLYQEAQGLRRCDRAHSGHPVTFLHGLQAGVAVPPQPAGNSVTGGTVARLYALRPRLGKVHEEISRWLPGFMPQFWRLALWPVSRSALPALRCWPTATSLHHGATA